MHLDAAAIAMNSCMQIEKVMEEGGFTAVVHAIGMLFETELNKYVRNKEGRRVKLGSNMAGVGIRVCSSSWVDVR